MEKFIIAAWLCCCLSITAGEDGLDAGNPEIENCKEGFIDIRENATNTINCTGFNGRDIIEWTFKRNDENITNGVATCDASSNCTVHQPGHFAVERSQSHSTLFYQQYDRQVDKEVNVTCKSRHQLSERSKTCTLNVINPAKLSSCTVEEDRDRGTLRGSCRFEHAYSDRRAFECNWFRETDGQPPTYFSGNITYDSGSHGSSGWCTFTNTSTDTDWDAGTYTYTIYFYPGPGTLTVNIGSLATSSPDVYFQTTKDSVHSTSSPDVSPPTNNVDSTSSPDVSLSTTKDSVDYTSPRTQEENDLPLGVIVGGTVAVVAVVIIVVVVVVVCVRRKRKQKPAGSALWSRNGNATDNDDFEEHINSMYVTSDDLDDTHSTDHKPPAIALRSSPNSHNGHPA